LNVAVNDQLEGPGRRILVGVDGSPHSKAALRWAITQARLAGATVEAITVWQNPLMSEYGYGWSTVIHDDQSIVTIAEKVLAETVAEVAGEQGVPVETHTRVVKGHPAEALVDAAAGAQLLVLGSRGHGTFAAILLGSTSHHCVQHAPCPVVVVPHDRTPPQ
jgi:nucleotide-binding universal stress UspA family protein